MNKDIRKISIGPDYKGGAMHYIVGQDVLSGSYKIHHIRHDEKTNALLVWIERNEEVVLWKEFRKTMPASIEYNINFK
ncbi:MAG TPA: hypothetical protein EYO58_06090 [Flavobacteriales bacterium]|nr:hypothetical protein [Flavobacteriales bacterium]HIB77181.1 hypothetical protein [Flavobacteriales bacterium]